MESPMEFADRRGLTFQDLSLLLRAMTHRSYMNEHPEALEDNERLEFLGDAALDFLTAAWLYDRYPEMNEGKLTRLRSELVRTEQLAYFAAQLGLGEVLLLGKGEEASGGRERPGLLCDSFEALIGALYLDGGLEAVTSFIEPLLENAVEVVLEEESMLDSRSRLQVWAQGTSGETPRYKTVDSFGPDHAKQFVVEVLVGGDALGRGQGHSKQKAAQRAAADALSHIGESHEQAGGQ